MASTRLRVSKLFAGKFGFLRVNHQKTFRSGNGDLRFRNSGWKVKMKLSTKSCFHRNMRICDLSNTENVIGIFGG